MKRNINDVALEKIWEHLPEMVNRGFLKIRFVENVITTMQVLRKKDMLGWRIWDNLRKSFWKFENSEIREKLLKMGKQT